jgi:hypothetical protein
VGSLIRVDIQGCRENECGVGRVDLRVLNRDCLSYQIDGVLEKKW